MEYKILICGPTGAGKTTAVGAVSDTKPISTEARNSDPGIAKPLTTVGLDYGVITLEGGETVALYGTPGQERFDFMWSILAQGALGVVILLDNSRSDPLADLDVYLKALWSVIRQEGIRAPACVVGVGRMEQHPRPDLERFATHLQAHQVLCPVVPVDVRQRQDVVSLIDLLLLQVEVAEQSCAAQV